MGERAVIVARVSSNGQQEASQLPIAQAWCDQHGYEVAHVEPIHGKSAKTGAHLVQLEVALRMIEHGQADVIVMVRLDRMSRQGLEAAILLRKRVREAGGRWEFARQTRLNGNGLEADREWARRAMDAQEESELRMERISEGYAEAMANGAAVHKARYGWKLTGYTQAKRWITDPAKAALVEQIFTRVANGDTLRSVADYARSQDDSIKWAPEHIRRIIDDSAYSTGIEETTVNGQPYSHQVPTLIDADLQARARAAVKAPYKYKRIPKSRFTGVLYCSCGTALLRTGQTRGMHYWKCPACNFRMRDDIASSAAETALWHHDGTLYDETLIRPADTRSVRRSALEREARGLSSKYAGNIAGMIARATEIEAELAAIDNEPTPRGHVERTPTGHTLGSLYRSMTDDVEVNAMLRSHQVRIVMMDSDGSMMCNFGIDESAL